jgi:hypothetical protein
MDNNKGDERGLVSAVSFSFFLEGETMKERD